METIQTDSKTRLNKYDNLKGLAIILVVFVHISNPLSNFSVRNDITLLMFPISMAIFFFVSGYFSKVDQNTQMKAFKQIFIPYLIFMTSWYLFSFLVYGANFPSFPYLIPTGGLWFLLALFWLRSFLPILTKIKYILPISILLALAIGLINFPEEIGDFLAIVRTFSYMPIFLAGYYFKNSKEYFKSMSSNISSKLKPLFAKISETLKENKKITFIALIAILIVLFFMYQDVPISFLEYKRSYASLEFGRKVGILLKLFCILSSIVVVFLVTYLMTNKKTFLTKLGRNSLAIYILHFYISNMSRRIFLKTDIGSAILSDPYITLLYSVILSALVLFIFSRDIVEKYMKKLIELVGNFLIKSENQKIN